MLKHDWAARWRWQPLLLVLALCPLAACETASTGSPIDEPDPGTVPCDSDESCPNGWRCSAGFCKPDGACDSNADCVAGLVCDTTDFACRSCGLDAECGLGKRCRADGLCKTAGCNGDTDCGEGQSCDLTTNRCVGDGPDRPDGGNEDVCRPACADGQICEMGRCVDGNSCSDARPCPEGFLCDGNRCRPLGTPCTSDAECAPDGCCHPELGNCALCSLTCADDQRWDPDLERCTSRGRPCEANGDCEDGCCQPASGRCGRCDGECSEDGHCARGYTCDTQAGRCSSGGMAADLGRDGDPCEESSECVEGFKCFEVIAKQCRARCSVAGGDDCEQPGYTCIPFANVCLPE